MLKFKYIFPTLLLGGVGLATWTSCEDDDEYTSRGDLFQPRLITLNNITGDQALIDGNSFRVAWYKVNDAISYTVEVSTDVNYSKPVVAVDVTEPTLVVKDIPYNTVYQVRVRSNAVDPVHTSTWAHFNSIKTEVRPAFASILQEVGEVGDEGATITWLVDAENPVDSISVTPMVNDTLKSVGRYLTQTEISAGKAVVTGLDKSTLYAVDVYDTSKPGKYDKPYNQLTFRTTGPALPPIEVSRFDDLGRILSKNNSDPTIPEGMEYHLPAGSYYQIQPFGIQKGFKLVGEKGSEPIQIEMSRNWDIAAASSATARMTIDKVEFENIEFLQTVDGSYFFNNSCDFDVKLFSFKGCKFSKFRRGFWRQKDEKNRHIQKMVIDDCIFDQLHGFSGGTYGTFNFEKDGNSVDTVLITNSTFMREERNAGNLFNYAKTYSKIHLEICNVTLYHYCALGRSRLIDLNNVGASSKLIIKNVLFATDCGQIYRASGNTTVTLENNYATSDCSQAVKGFRSDKNEDAKLPISADELFVDGPNGNLTIKDPNSIIVKNRVGDPRWIPDTSSSFLIGE